MKVERRFTYKFTNYRLNDSDVEKMRRADPALADSRPTADLLSFSIDSSSSLSPLFFALIEGEKGSISSQIAVKISLTAMTNAVGALGGESAPAKGLVKEYPASAEIVRIAMRDANKEVYDYAHRMFVGGKVAATGVVGAYDGSKVSIGKVGNYECILIRQGRLLPFFENAEKNEDRSGMLERFIGANAQILVDLASAAVEQGDIIAVSSIASGGGLFDSLSSILGNTEATLDHLAVKMVEQGAAAVVKRTAAGALMIEQNVMGFLLRVGPEALSVTDVL